MTTTIIITTKMTTTINGLMIQSITMKSKSQSKSSSLNMKSLLAAAFMFYQVMVICLLSFAYASPSSSMDDNQFFLPSHHYDIVHSTTFSSSTDCDQVFISTTLNITHGTRNGTFVGPSFMIPMPATTVSSIISSINDSVGDQSSSVNPLLGSNNESNRYTRQCIYTFIAGPYERVRVSFTKFSLRSELPECLDEYVDVYAELKNPDSDLLSTPFGGRYCDLVIPHDRISLFQTIVISFYTAKLMDGTILNGSDIFEGTYEFVNATPYVAGTPMPNEICSYTIYSEVRREGEFMSPTYPGVYPKNITCYYLFKGVKGQRVKLEFMDFDLFYGGSHCPYDYVKIYDGETTRAPLINTYCGQQRQLFVFSSGINLLVQFTTLKRISSVNQNRGFSGYYEFSEKFVNLGFILNNENSEHIRGTECDQKIFSRKESNGTIYAPNYPFLYHSNIMCKYFLYGLQDAQNLERINFHFEMLQIPTKDVNECTDAYVRLYTQLQAMDEFDYVFCGETIPPPVVSDGPLLLVVFNSGSTQGQGFKAHYWFETDFKIMGTQASPGQCHFSYVSSGSKSGEFNSPRHPSNYPSNTYCIFEFFGEPDEQVKLVFNQFKFSDAEVSSLSIPGYNEKCTHDWLEVYSVESGSGREQFYGRYCGFTAPGPILTETGVSQIKVIVNTDENEVSSGFSATYRFDRASDRVQDCGGNFTNLENGIIQTPNYPNNYPATMQVCNWFITVRSGSKVLLYFDEFSVEGDPPNRGCPGAIVRVWPDLNQKSIELCGEKLNLRDKQYISDNNVMRITFLTAQKAVGALGFSAIWTEIDMPSDNNDVRVKNMTAFGPCMASTAISNPSTNQQQELIQSTSSLSSSSSSSSSLDIPINTMPYQCQKHGYCISGKLHCNGVQNCGFDDDSDESDCIHEVKINIVELVGGMTGLLMFIFFAIGIICLTIILIINWYRRSSGDEKNVGHIIDKTCQHYFAHPTAPDYSTYYQSDMATTMGIGTPHRLIDVMTVSSSSTTPGATGTGGGGNHNQMIKNVRWPSVSNSADSGHVTTAVTSEQPDSMFMETTNPANTITDEPIGDPNSPPIPPPPPPPMNRSLLNLRQSSLINFNQYGDNIGTNPTSTNCGTFKSDVNAGTGHHAHYQSSTLARNNFTASANGNNNNRTTMTMTMNRSMSRQTDSRISTFTAAASTPYTPYCTLPDGGGSSKLSIQQKQQMHCPSQSTIANRNNRISSIHHHHDNSRQNTSPGNTHQIESMLPPMDSLDSGCGAGQLSSRATKITIDDDDDNDVMNDDDHEDNDNGIDGDDDTMNNNMMLLMDVDNNSLLGNKDATGNGDYLMMTDHEERTLLRSLNNNHNYGKSDALATNGEESDSIHETQPSISVSSLRKYQISRLQNTGKNTLSTSSESKQSQQSSSHPPSTWHHPTDVFTIATPNANYHLHQHQHEQQHGHHQHHHHHHHSSLIVDD
ncbi:uncharacterized protein LOC124494340 isoform X1 [Dermatophagoides farinae]|uniref:uncharacterized protein LOC124494340 isoform X1 n=1 Tax=Dermatophagoides farinae TaxID=6954 RepID=UPI003F601839